MLRKALRGVFRRRRRGELVRMPVRVRDERARKSA
jgi:hypothetical protein